MENKDNNCNETTIAKKIHKKIKDYGVSKLFKDNKDKFDNIKVSLNNYRNCFSRLLKYPEGKLFDNMYLLQVILSSLGITFEDLFSDNQIKENDIVEKRDINLEDLNKTIEKLSLEIKNLSDKVGEEKKPKFKKSIAYFFCLIIVNDIANFSNKEEDENKEEEDSMLARLLDNKNDPRVNIILINKYYRYYIPREKLVSDYFKNSQDDKHIYNDNLAFCLFLIFVQTILTINLLKRFNSDVKEIFRTLNQIKKHLNNFLKFLNICSVPNDFSFNTLKTSETNKLLADYTSLIKNITMKSLSIDIKKKNDMKTIFERILFSENPMSYNITFDVKDDDASQLNFCENSIKNLIDRLKEVTEKK
ncbi:MAG TPA: hypothetical protein DC057_14490 [Spirochaetia bacterium]|nr:hypothetical protein [Spirochaetia bacterium]